MLEIIPIDTPSLADATRVRALATPGLAVDDELDNAAVAGVPLEQPGRATA